MLMHRGFIHLKKKKKGNVMGISNFSQMVTQINGFVALKYIKYIYCKEKG